MNRIVPAATRRRLPQCWFPSPAANRPLPPIRRRRGCFPARVAAAKPVQKTPRRESVQPGEIEAFEQTPLLAKLPAYVENSMWTSATASRRINCLRSCPSPG